MNETFLLHQIQYFTFFSYAAGLLFGWSSVLIPIWKEWQLFSKRFMVIYFIALLIGIALIIPFPKETFFSYLGSLGCSFALIWWGMVFFLIGMYTTESAFKKHQLD